MSIPNAVTAKILELHQRAGSPSSRAVAYRSDGKVSHTTVAYLLSGKSCPRWSALASIAEALRATPQDMRELHRLYSAAEEQRKALRAAAHKPRIREGLVIQPGDTVVVTVDEVDGDVQEYAAQLHEMFPNNKVKLIVGGSIAVIRAGEEVAA